MNGVCVHVPGLWVNFFRRGQHVSIASIALGACWGDGDSVNEEKKVLFLDTSQEILFSARF